MAGDLNFHTLGFADAGRIAAVRLRCYGKGVFELAEFERHMMGDRRARDGDFLVAERGGQDVGTITSLSLTMWVRGSAVPCQGIAWVGTIQTMRRGGSAGGRRGIASALMARAIELGRERGQVVSALMPFRASFYEHFGYGNAERRAVWTVPTSCLPSGESEGFRYATDADLPEMQRCGQRITEGGRCDIETSAESWRTYQAHWPEGFMFVDGIGDRGPIGGFMLLRNVVENGRRIADITARGSDSPRGLRRQLYLLGTMRDQFGAARLTLPVDVPLNRLLRETQLPHRQVEHATASVEIQTRMQMRVLDHRRLVESLRLADGARGGATIAVRESEGHESRFRIEIEKGRCAWAASSATPGATMSDVTWASVVSGELAAGMAAALGLIDVAEPAALGVLSALSDGPMPFGNEYF